MQSSLVGSPSTEDVDRAGLEPALVAWRSVLGPAYVVLDPAELRAAATATFATTQRVPAILRPANCAEVQECLRIANRYRVPLYPISRGKNWGYGSRVPTDTACAILDLGRMNRILDYDEKLAYVTIEPGVTFRQLFDFLTQAGSNLMLNATGGPPDGSVIGNLIERGMGVGPYADRAQHACGFEVVLPSGELVHTGFGRFETPLASLNSWGVGPHLNGLFLQSNYGVITRVTLWLAPKPAYLHTFYFGLRHAERVPPLIEALQQLKLAGPASAQYSLWNDYKMLATLQQYPWQAAGARTPLPADLRAELREQWGVAPWNGFGAIYSATARQGRAERAIVAKALRGKVDDLGFVSDTTARAAHALSRPLRWLTGYDIGKTTRPHMRDASPWLGAPHGNLASMYWRKQSPIPATPDPDADGCGVIWCSPCLPFSGRHVGAAIELAERAIAAYQFEPNIALLCATPRTVYAIIALIFDRAIQGEDQRALACHDALLGQLVSHGYLPYRLGLQSMQALPAPIDDTEALHQALKSALDPNNILAPGRYSF